jgi:hypothetical protein
VLSCVEARTNFCKIIYGFGQNRAGCEACLFNLLQSICLPCSCCRVLAATANIQTVEQERCMLTGEAGLDSERKSSGVQ